RGAHLAIAEFRMLVDVAPPRGDLRQLLLDHGLYLAGGGRMQRRGNDGGKRQGDGGAMHAASPRRVMADASAPAAFRLHRRRPPRGPRRWVRAEHRSTT